MKPRKTNREPRQEAQAQYPNRSATAHSAAASLTDAEVGEKLERGNRRVVFNGLGVR